MPKLAGKRVVITGASRGLGRSLATLGASAGARVLGIARGAGLEATMAAIGGDALACDLADAGEVSGLVERVESEFGAVDVWIHNAAIEITSLFAETDAAAMRQLVQVNLLAPMEINRQLLPRMLTRRSGHLVHISSMTASAAVAGMCSYATSKAGLSSFHRTLEHELQGQPIGMTLAELGPMPTEMLANIQTVERTRLQLQRFSKLGLMPSVPPQTAAAAIVRAIERDAARVRVPRRAALFPMLSGFSQAFVSLMVRDLR